MDSEQKIMKVIGSILSMALLILFTKSGFAQDPVLKSLEASMKHKMKNGKLLKKERTSNGMVFFWLEDTVKINTGISFYEEKEEAESSFQKLLLKVPVPPVKQLDSYGEEAYLFQSERSEQCMVLLRNDKIILHVNAGSYPVSKKYIKTIMKELKSNK